MLVARHTYVIGITNRVAGSWAYPACWPALFAMLQFELDQDHVATPPSRHHPGLTHHDAPPWPCLPAAPELVTYNKLGTDGQRAGRKFQIRDQSKLPHTMQPESRRPPRTWRSKVSTKKAKSLNWPPHNNDTRVEDKYKRQCSGIQHNAITCFTVYPKRGKA